MTKKKFLLILLFVIVYGFSFSQNLNIKTYKLDNGLTVILNEDNSQPKVFGTVVCRAGGKNDPVDGTGMAHYQEHMLFKGTQEIGTTNWEKEKVHIDKIFELYDKLAQTTDPTERENIQQLINNESLEANKYAIQNEFSNLLKVIGGTDLNAGTGWDITVYYNAFPPNQMEAWLELYSHRFENPVFRGFQQELEVVYEEKNLYSDIFIFPILEQFNKQFFKKHPYGQQTLIGTTENLKNPSLSKMYKFFKTFYVPNNMALIISGDFNAEEIMPMIQEKFGKWEYKELPKPITYEEEPFKGREFIEANLSPIPLGFIGFRTPPAGHEDEYALEIFYSLLSNSNGTGLFDKLTIDNKILAAQVMPMPNYDYGATIFLIIPKIMTQKLEEAEALILGEIEKIKKGEITDEQIDAIKNVLYLKKQLEFENLENRTYLFADAFGLNKDINEYIYGFKKIKDITKDDIVKVANKYFGENFIAFYSKIGTAPKDKIEKPNYTPIISNTEEKSAYAKKIESLTTKEFEFDFIDFNNDVKVTEIKPNCNLYYVQNKMNDIFSATIKIGVGTHKIPMLKYAVQLLNVAGTEKYNVNEFKFEISKLGATYYFYCDDDYTYLEVQGIEKNAKQIFSLLNTLYKNPVIEQEKVNILLEGEKTARQMEKSEPDNVADALLDYVLYETESDYIDRLTLKEIKKLDVNNLKNEYLKAINYQTEIHYVGNIEIMSDKDVVNMFKTEFTTPDNLTKTSSPEYKEFKKSSENTIYFVNKKKASQSKIFILINGEPFDISQQPVIEAFNLYFGGDFSGLVLQEIREYRSLAYSAGAWYQTAKLKGKNSLFIGYVGTQTDKSLEALEVFKNLITNMPEKIERMEMIRSYLTLSAITEKPNFRNLSQYVSRMKNKGFTSDPREQNVKQLKKMEFATIVDFYTKSIKNKPITYAIVGDKSKINMKELEKYGKIIYVKEKDLFRD